MRTLIQGGTVVGADHETVADVLVDGEEIAAVGSFGDVDAEVIDASGCYVLPGLIDNHTHMSMPFGGTRSIDDYDTGTQRGGRRRDHLHRRLRAAEGAGRPALVARGVAGRAAGAAHVDYGFHMAITNADDGTFADMARDGRRGRLHVQGLPRLPRRADGHRRPLPRACSSSTATGGAHDGARRERLAPSTCSSSARSPPARPIRSTTRTRARRSSRPRRRAARCASPSTPARRSTSST